MYDLILVLCFLSLLDWKSFCKNIGIWRESVSEYRRRTAARFEEARAAAAEERQLHRALEECSRKLCELVTRYACYRHRTELLFFQVPYYGELYLDAETADIRRLDILCYSKMSGIDEIDRSFSPLVQFFLIKRKIRMIRGALALLAKDANCPSADQLFVEFYELHEGAERLVKPGVTVAYAEYYARMELQSFERELEGVNSRLKRDEERLRVSAGQPAVY